MPPPQNHSEVDSPLCDGDPLAKALARLQPTPTVVATPEFYFQAGAASQQRRVNFWRGLALGPSLVVSLALGGVLLHGPGALPPRAKDPPSHPPTFAAAEPPPREPWKLEAAPHPRRLEASETEYPTQALDFLCSLDDSPTLEERARWAVLRRDILTAGLGVVPDTGSHPTPAPVAWESGGLSPGIFAAPTTPAKAREPEPE